MRGHLRKRSKNSWTIVLTLPQDETGKQRQRWLTVEGNRHAAEDELTRQLELLRTNKFIEPSTTTFSQFAEKWLDFIRGQVAGKTAERYSEIVKKHLIPEFGNIVLSQIRPTMIQDYYARAFSSGRRDGRGGLNPQTIQHHHRVIRQLLKRAVDLQTLAYNPADSAKAPRPKPRELVPPTDKEVAALVEHAKGTRIHVPLLVAIGSGVRRGELLAARWSDLDMEAGKLAIRQSLEETKGSLAFKPPKTKKGQRVIVLSQSLITVLRRHRAEQAAARLALGPAYQDHDLIFGGPDGQPWRPSAFTGSFIELAKRARVATHLHMMRHYHATQLLQQGIHPKVVSERLGHANISITLDVYSHVVPGLQEQAAAKFDTTLQALGIE